MKMEEQILLVISFIACAPFIYLLLCFFISLSHDIILSIIKSHKEKICSKTERRSLP